MFLVTRGVAEEACDEFDFVGDASGRTVEFCLSDRAEGLDAFECCLRGGGVPKSARRSEQPL